MPKIRVTFEMYVAEGRLVDPSDPNNYNLCMVDVLREGGRTWDTELNDSPHDYEYSLRPTVVIE